MSEKVVLWLEDDGTYEDQFGETNECTVVRQQVVAKLVDKGSYKGGYDQTVRTYTYEDPFGRRFKFVNRGISYSGPGRRYSSLDDRDYDGAWKKAKKVSYDSPYLTPDGENRVEIIDENHDPGYEFYENTQLSFS